MVAVVHEVEARRPRSPRYGTPAEIVRRAWVHLSDPSLRPLERLFFETYARGANGEAPFDQFVPGAVDTWLSRHPGPARSRPGAHQARPRRHPRAPARPRGDGRCGRDHAPLVRFAEFLAGASSAPLVGSRASRRRSR